METHYHNGIDQERINLKDLAGTPANTYLSSSSVLQASADTERTTTNTSYSLMKQVNIYRSGTVKVSYDAKSTTSGYSGTGDVRVSNVSKAETSITATDYTTVSVDINVVAGDTIDLYGKVPLGTFYIKNFRIYYDINTVSDDHKIIID